MNDYGNIAAGVGFGLFIAFIIIYLGTIALVLWIGYLIMRTAVKNGILLADAERARSQGPAGGYPGQPPQYPGQPPQHPGPPPQSGQPPQQPPPTQ